MNFLIDYALSPRVAAGLAAAGRDAVHVRGDAMQVASDEEIFERAQHATRVVAPDSDAKGPLSAESERRGRRNNKRRHARP